MKTLTQYQCVHCGTIYSQKNKAMECEKYHVTDMKLVEKIYHAKGVATEFPERLVLETKDGKRVRYQRT